VRVTRGAHSTELWLSKDDTWRWAHRSGHAWPASTLSGHRLYVKLDARGDLVDVAVDSDRGRGRYVDSHELDAIIADAIGSAHLAAGDPLVRGEWRRGKPGGGIRLFEDRRRSLTAEARRRSAQAKRQRRTRRGTFA